MSNIACIFMLASRHYEMGGKKKCNLKLKPQLPNNVKFGNTSKLDQKAALMQDVFGWMCRPSKSALIWDQNHWVSPTGHM